MAAMTTWKTFGAIALALAIFGCAGAGMEAYTPTNTKTKHSEDVLLEASTRAVEKLDHMVANRNRDAYTLETREREVAVSSVPKLSYKYSFQIFTKGGVLRIQSTCVENSSMERTEFEDCGEDRPEKVNQEQQALEKKILEIAAKMEEAPAF